MGGSEVSESKHYGRWLISLPHFGENSRMQHTSSYHTKIGSLGVQGHPPATCPNTLGTRFIVPPHRQCGSADGLVLPTSSRADACQTSGRPPVECSQKPPSQVEDAAKDAAKDAAAAAVSAAATATPPPPLLLPSLLLRWRWWSRWQRWRQRRRRWR